MTEEQQNPKVPPPRPPPPLRQTSRSSTFDGSIRLNDLLRAEEDEGKIESVSLQSTVSGDSSIAFAEPATTYFDEEKDVLLSPTVKFRGRSPLTKSQSTDAQISDRDSVSIGSNDSHPSKFQSLIDKAKAKGKKLVHRKKGKKNKDAADSEDAADEVADEALQVDMEERVIEQQVLRQRLNNPVGAVPPAVSISEPPIPPRNVRDGARKIPFFKFRLTVAALMLVSTLFLPYFLSGFLWGVYICTVAFLYAFVSKPINVSHGKMTEEIVQKVSEEIDRQKTHHSAIVYKGWMNELRGRYDPANYHPNMTRSVLVRLDGKYLRISRPERNVIKHTFPNDPTITEPEPTMIGQSLFDLTNAEVTLRPKSLAPRRWWVRKYPIHIRLASRESGITTVGTLPRSKSGKHDVTPDEFDSESSEYDAESSDEDTFNPDIKVHKKSISMNDLSRTGHSINAARPSLSNVKVPRGKSIYLFVRSHREKERWFHRLREVCSQYRTSAAGVSGSTMDDSAMRRMSAFTVPDSAIRDFANMSVNSEYFHYISSSVQFSRYMADVLCTSPVVEIAKPENGIIYMDLGRYRYTPSLSDQQSGVVSAANAFASRIFYDFCRDEYWVRQVRGKIQSKLATIHLPYFIETLELSSLELGANPPRIVGVHTPFLNDWGLWLDLEIQYPGGLQLVLETKVNLMKLKAEDKDGGTKRKPSRMSEQSGHSHHYSDEERAISPESSPDEDADTNGKPDNSGGKGKKFLSFVDKLAHSQIFQGATDLKPVKKMMEGISSTRLILNVEVTSLEGTMAINIPPPPSDRFWYGFRVSPKLTLKGVPQVGDRSVEFTAVSDWIENRLRILLEKNLVMPGMDDIILPAMSGNEMLKFGYNK